MTTRITAPIRFSPWPSDPACIGATPTPLDYKIALLAMRQPRLDGRLVIMPEIDLSAYTCRAVIDWVWVEFETARVTQCIAIRGHMEGVLGRQPFVTGPREPHNVTKPWNETGTHFRMKIQDPDPWEIYHLEAVLSAYRGLVGPVRLIGIEVALDWYARSHSHEDRWAMVGTLHRHHLPLIRGLDVWDADLRHTYTKPKASPEDEEGSGTDFVIHDRRWIVEGKPDRGRVVSDLALADANARERVLRLAGHHAPYVDSIVYRGPREGPVMFRVQNKVSDGRYPEKGKLTRLSAKDSRARVEVTLLHEAVAEAGLNTVQGLIGHSFTGLRKRYFPFWLATTPGGVRMDGRAPSRKDLLMGGRLQRVFAESGVYGAWLYEEAARLQQEELRSERKALEGEAMRNRRVYRGEARHLVAWQEMNKRAASAFLRLGDAWSPEPIERRLAMFAPHDAA